MKRLTLILLALLATSVKADAFQPIDTRSAFLSVVEGRELTQFGITLRVSADGRIDGRAFGQQVQGSWRWENGFFCRDMSWGSRVIEDNCQAVLLQDRTLRFIADQGAGDTADLRLRGE